MLWLCLACGSYYAIVPCILRANSPLPPLFMRIPHPRNSLELVPSPKRCIRALRCLGRKPVILVKTTSRKLRISRPGVVGGDPVSDPIQVLVGVLVPTLLGVIIQVLVGILIPVLTGILIQVLVGALVRVLVRVLIPSILRVPFPGLLRVLIRVLVGILVLVLMWGLIRVLMVVLVPVLVGVLISALVGTLVPDSMGVLIPAHRRAYGPVRGSGQTACANLGLTPAQLGLSSLPMDSGLSPARREISNSLLRPRNYPAFGSEPRMEAACPRRTIWPH
jgi:hypothetical protein